ncbi:MAG TPA: hypothetical protein DIC45_05665 [Comamonadaceae bacterium]|uniref:DUF262 domain-containing protein n=1 Tax=Pulveribacter sp. TaxID=2678893 RepID=UPI000EE303C8|nr:DUF262 domain-containing protein [Pulveribacter sp.]HCL85981.1 hypothetical protein [Comamonadaceae bacterium]
MDFQQQSYTIDQLIQRVRTGRLALPDFQRDFVWNPSRVVELLDSVSRQWPIGSLLLLSGPQPFAIRSIESGPEITDDELDLYVLDGQQRLTSLYHAVADVSDYCYFIDFAALIRGEDEYISWEKRSQFNIKYPSINARADAYIALITDIWDTQSFYGWLECLPSQKSRAECVELRETRIPGLHSKVYKVMAIVLDQTIALEALARIFETLNRTGVALTAFDLMVATLYPTGFKLRDEWESAVDMNEAIARLGPDELEVIKLVSLLVRGIYGKRQSKGVRQGDLLRLDKTKIQELWRESVDLYEHALRFCMREFGVTSQDLVPSWGMVLGVAAWLRFKPADDFGVRSWWYDRLFTQHFSQASNTRIISEFDALLNHASGAEVWPTNQPRANMDLPAKANGVLMRGVGAMLVQRGSRDLLSGRPLREFSRVAFRALQSDGQLKRPKSADLLNSIVLVSDETDKKLGKSANLRDLPKSAMEIVAEQGIAMDELKRPSSFFSTTGVQGAKEFAR